MSNKVYSAEDLAREYDESARRVLEDVTLRQEYQMELLERLYDETREKIQKQIDEERENLEVALRTNRRLLHQPAEMPGNRDRALAYMLHHQHLDKLEKIDSVNDLEQYWQKVALADDVIGVKACLLRGITLVATNVIEPILAEYESWREVYEAYVEAHEDLRDYSRSPHAFFGAGRLRTPREYLA